MNFVYTGYPNEPKTLLSIEPNSHYTVYELIEILNKLIKDGQRGARQ